MTIKTSMGGWSVYQMGDTDEWRDTQSYIARDLLDTIPFNAGTWQKLDVSQSSAHNTYELLNVSVVWDMPATLMVAQAMFDPDLPWAEAHFHERVGWEPVNPGTTHDQWPYHANGATLHLKDGRYDHNYMERMWASSLRVGVGWDTRLTVPWSGYRFATGDLEHVLELLKRDPGTRQAYLPIWFPEDTGSRHGQRVPCSLGYHFIMRDGLLHMTYYLRSCEIYRHMTNDLYLATRLAQWVAQHIDAQVGQAITHIVSLHGFVGDRQHIEAMT